MDGVRWLFLVLRIIADKVVTCELAHCHGATSDLLSDHGERIHNGLSTFRIQCHFKFDQHIRPFCWGDPLSTHSDI